MRGRPPGSPNKQSAAVKQCLINAFEAMGGHKNLVKWALENQTEFYKLWAKLIPVQVDGNVNHINTVEIVLRDDRTEQDTPLIFAAETKGGPPITSH